MRRFGKNGKRAAGETDQRFCRREACRSRNRRERHLFFDALHASSVSSSAAKAQRAELAYAWALRTGRRIAGKNEKTAVQGRRKSSHNFWILRLSIGYSPAHRQRRPHVTQFCPTSAYTAPLARLGQRAMRRHSARLLAKVPQRIGDINRGDRALHSVSRPRHSAWCSERASGRATGFADRTRWRSGPTE